jgi:hypothetical protein
MMCVAGKERKTSQDGPAVNYPRCFFFFPFPRFDYPSPTRPIASMSVILIGPSIPSSSIVLLSALSALTSKSRPDVDHVA